MRYWLVLSCVVVVYWLVDAVVIVCDGSVPRVLVWLRIELRGLVVDFLPIVPVL